MQKRIRNTDNIYNSNKKADSMKYMRNQNTEGERIKDGLEKEEESKIKGNKGEEEKKKDNNGINESS